MDRNGIFPGDLCSLTLSCHSRSWSQSDRGFSRVWCVCEGVCVCVCVCVRVWRENQTKEIQMMMKEDYE